MNPIKRLFLFCLILAPGVISAADKKFPVSEIPDSLKENADLVYRRDEMTFSILSRSRAVQHSYVVITILNERGRRAATQFVPYSKLVKVNSISGAVYDASGDLVRKLKTGDIIDRSSTGSNLYDDDRVKISELNNPSYPFTIEFESEVEYKFLFYIPKWYVNPGRRTSVQQSKFTIAYVDDAKPRYKVYNTGKLPIVTRANSMESLTWSFENIPVGEPEPYGPQLAEITPMIVAAPNSFQYESYAGTMKDWTSFGKWIATLNEGRGLLPEETKKKVSELIQGKTTAEEKAEVLYQFLQDKTRYVSVQIGIGGYQPFDASMVDRTSYGDCKALSNYMVSLLREAGVKANYVLIRAGEDEEDMDASFPSTQFNHAVAAVPMQKDTLWLECTSQTNPFGYSGTFTGDRHALMITEQGASVVRTPVYPQSNNKQIRTATVILNKDGSAKANVKTIYSGLQYENDHLDHYLDQSAEDQKKWIQENTGIPSFDVNKFSFTNKKGRLPEATVALDLSVRNFGSVSGKRIFVNPNLMNRRTSVPARVDKRKTPVVMSFAFEDEDVIEISFPEELYPEFMPQPIHHESRFGVYDAAFTLEAGKLTYTRKFKMKKGRFAPETYAELVDFFKNISKADNLKLVLLTKT